MTKVSKKKKEQKKQKITQAIRQVTRAPTILEVSKDNQVVKIKEATNYSYKLTNSSGLYST